MTRMRKLIAIAGVVCLTSMGAAAESPTIERIKQRGELRIGIGVGFMPLEMLDKTGEIVGFDIDLGRVLARKLGVKLTPVNTAWDGIIPSLLTDKFDVLMGGMSITAERAQRVDFCTPYFESGQSVLLNRKLISRVKTYSDLNDARFKIVTELGTPGDIVARKLFAKAAIRSFEAHTDAAMEVRNGRADGFVSDEISNSIIAAQNKDGLVNLVLPLAKEQVGWAVRKSDPAFRIWLNEALAEMRADGTYQALYKKWFESDAWLMNIR